MCNPFSVEQVKRASRQPSAGLLERTASVSSALSTDKLDVDLLDAMKRSPAFGPVSVNDNAVAGREEHF